MAPASHRAFLFFERKVKEAVGETSTEQYPVHAYMKPGNLVVVLEVTAADGTTSRRSKVWDVQLR